MTLKRFGIEVTLVDQDDPKEELAKAFRPNTKAVFAETVSNPAGVILDIEKFAALAHEHRVPLICDIPLPRPFTAVPLNSERTL